jgi:hypothetical protein
MLLDIRVYSIMDCLVSCTRIGIAPACIANYWIVPMVPLDACKWGLGVQSFYIPVLNLAQTVAFFGGVSMADFMNIYLIRLDLLLLEKCADIITDQQIVAARLPCSCMYDLCYIYLYLEPITSSAVYSHGIQ